MKIVIWGVTTLGKYLIDNIYENERNIRPVAFVDNNPKLQGSMVDGIPVISCEQLLDTIDMQELTVLLAVKGGEQIFQIFQQLEQNSLNNLGVVKSGVLLSKKIINPCAQQGEIIWRIYNGEKYRVIPRIEVYLTKKCNLNCKGCQHFSSIYKEENDYPLEKYESDLLQLRKVGKLCRLGILGGEPFLSKKLAQYLEISRSIFPETDIEIVTNGLLIPKVEESVLLSIKNNNVNILISTYHPTMKNATQITERLDRYNIKWKFLYKEEITHFIRPLTLYPINDADMAIKGCLAHWCTCLENGKLYKCVYDALLNDFYQHYGVEEHHEGGTDIDLDEDILYQKIVDYALKPADICKHCVGKPEQIPWSVKVNPSLEDWLYKDGVYDISGKE